jgi:hypothetical protein
LEGGYTTVGISIAVASAHRLVHIQAEYVWVDEVGVDARLTAFAIAEVGVNGTVVIGAVGPEGATARDGRAYAIYQTVTKEKVARPQVYSG